METTETTHLFFRSDYFTNIVQALISREGIDVSLNEWNDELSNIVIPSSEVGKLSREARVFPKKKIVPIKTDSVPQKGEAVTVQFEEKNPIYALDMVRAELVPFQKTEEGSKETYRLDFYDPITKKLFAYASTYAECKFLEMMKSQGVTLVKLPFHNYTEGESIERAIIASFQTYDAEINNEPFYKYNDKELLLIVNSKLLNKQN